MGLMDLMQFKVLATLTLDRNPVCVPARDPECQGIT